MIGQAFLFFPLKHKSGNKKRDKKDISFGRITIPTINLSKGDAVESISKCKLFYWEIDFKYFSHLQFCELQARLTREMATKTRFRESIRKL